MSRLVVFPNDPLASYLAKGEIKPRYFNPNDCFDEVHVVSLWDEVHPPSEFQTLAGRARLWIHSPLARPISLRSPATYWRGFRAVAGLVRSLRPDVVRAYNNRLSRCRQNLCMQRISVDEVFDTVCAVYESADDGGHG